MTKIWLILLTFGVEPSATLIDDFDSPRACRVAAQTFQSTETQFATCVATEKETDQ